MSEKSPEAAASEPVCEDIQHQLYTGRPGPRHRREPLLREGPTPAHATTHDWYVAVAHTVRTVCSNTGSGPSRPGSASRGSSATLSAEFCRAPIWGTPCSTLASRPR